MELSQTSVTYDQLVSSWNYSYTCSRINFTTERRFKEMFTFWPSSSDKRTKFQLVNKIQTPTGTTPNTRCNTMLILLQVHLRFVQLAP